MSGHRLNVSQLSREARVRDAHSWLAGAFDVDRDKLVVMSYFEKSAGGSQPSEWQATIVCRIPEDENLTVVGYFRWVRFETGNVKPAFEWVRVTNLTGPLK